MVFPSPPSISVWRFGDGGVEASGVEVWDVCEGELMRGAGVGEGEGVVGRGEGFCEGFVEGAGFGVEEGRGLCEACDCII